MKYGSDREGGGKFRSEGGEVRCGKERGEVKCGSDREGGGEVWE